jgi:hypothetical protein
MQDKTPKNKNKKRHGYWEVYSNSNTLSYTGLYVNGNLYGYGILFKEKEYYAR